MEWWRSEATYLLVCLSWEASHLTFFSYIFISSSNGVFFSLFETAVNCIDLFVTCVLLLVLLGVWCGVDSCYGWPDWTGLCCVMLVLMLTLGSFEVEWMGRGGGPWCNICAW